MTAPVHTTMLALFAMLVPLASAPAQGARPTGHLPVVELRPGMVITTSVRVAPKTYRLPAPASLDSAVITVRGEHITVDFAGAVIEGIAPSTDPDHAAGVAIRIDGGQDVHILHARISGYKVGILARHTRGLELADDDLSYNWKPYLYSGIEHESLVDWLSFHNNEHDEWLRYGAAIYLADVRGGRIHGNRVEQGMNGLMLVRSDSVRITGNTFSYNSGLGIGLYRSSFNTIMHNRADYDVRGYSDPFYHRGQDSADLLMYEQSSHNVVAYNSMTHGGDGLFVWAGQSTMDTGVGGVNDNLFYGNDFSFAPANCMEATFSRNTFVANRLEGCEYGLWAGYSYDSRVVGNLFVRNRTGIGIEHGQSNLIAHNRFVGDAVAVNVWANPTEPSDWGYPKHRDTRSRDYRVEGNVFSHNRVGVRAANTSGLAVTNNRFVKVDSVTVLGDAPGYRFAGNVVRGASGGREASAAQYAGGAGEAGAARAVGDAGATHAVGGARAVDTRAAAAAADTSSLSPLPPLPAEYARLAPVPMAGAITPARSPVERRSRATIIVDEWGPYDWRSPKLWPVDSAHELPLRLRVLGPPGTWRVLTRRGIAALSRSSGRTGDTIAVTPERNAIDDWALVLEYRGAATISPRGERHAAGQPVRFSYSRFEPPIQWTARVFAWSDSTDPRNHATAFAALLRSAPAATLHPRRLDYEGYGRVVPGTPAEHVALEATGTVVLAPGAYTVRTISDDGVRVWIDGSIAIDHWAPHGSALDFASLGGGRHEIRVQYYQVDGWNELRLEIVRGTKRPPGTPSSP